ncbi:NADH:flavin oxidoreductase/NADH oxidase family protein [Parasphingopyxis algicola]|uniref:NADH:flavin oxidoreductase/NADH oxidase family protein n=1 Tax=Parasphingopyxis algicola TaxID=2026624 RepID=UPI0015A45B64|nr:NADH:flavin oxidoreductase/NADH oxidase family protein [Parasphingopyxis algicola]QLC23700.1 NADH:flavin oxidoreductase/NADH oxidase family protein [Parasphingopyxis algicola]
MSAPELAEPLTLPCGATLPNRIAKAAMTEGLATIDGKPTEELERLYGIWSDGGAGMLLSGNIQVDRDHLERPGNVIIHGEPDTELATRLASWAAAATRSGNHFWAQLSHGGRQTQAIVNPHPKAPSAVKLGLPGGQFGEPVALTVDEIHDIRDQFAIAAKAAQDAGFTGVQIHGAHGYLLSSFLSPRANQREDDYGGSLENRARFLLETVSAVRDAVGQDFPVSVKLNSADFQRGGFQFEDSLQVAQWLGDAGIDLLEISGGNYEQPKLLGIEGMEAEQKQNVAPSTARREAYFVDFALAMQDKVSVPLMVTGGFRSRAAMDYALDSGAADVIGIGRPFCHTPDAARQMLNGSEKLPTPEDELALIPNWLGFLKRLQMLKAIDGFATQYWFYSQLYALGRTGNTAPERSVFAAFREVEATHKRLMARRG